MHESFSNQHTSATFYHYVKKKYNWEQLWWRWVVLLFNESEGFVRFYPHRPLSWQLDNTRRESVKSRLKHASKQSSTLSKSPYTYGQCKTFLFVVHCFAFFFLETSKTTLPACGTNTLINVAYCLDDESCSQSELIVLIYAADKMPEMIQAQKRRYDWSKISTVSTLEVLHQTTLSANLSLSIFHHESTSSLIFISSGHQKKMKWEKMSALRVNRIL